jgi:hypothetical protein
MPVCCEPVCGEAAHARPLCAEAVVRGSRAAIDLETVDSQTVDLATIE